MGSVIPVHPLQLREPGDFEWSILSIFLVFFVFFCIWEEVRCRRD